MFLMYQVHWSFCDLFYVLKVWLNDVIIYVKGGPEPFEKEIHEILGSKREDLFSDPFFEKYKKMSGSFFVPASSRKFI